jgi:hypothetical protein
VQKGLQKQPQNPGEIIGGRPDFTGKSLIFEEKAGFIAD